MSGKIWLSSDLADKLICLFNTLYDETESLTWISGKPSIYEAHWMYAKEMECTYDVFGDSDGMYFNLSLDYDIMIYLPRTTKVYNEFWEELVKEFGDNAEVVPNFFEICTGDSEESTEITFKVNLRDPNKDLDFSRKIARAMVDAVEETDFIRVVQYFEGDEEENVVDNFRYNSCGVLDGTYYVGIRLVIA